MVYKSKKVEAYKIIDKMYYDGKLIINIYYAINTSFGYGKKIVDDRLELLDGINEKKVNKIEKQINKEQKTNSQ